MLAPPSRMNFKFGKYPLILEFEEGFAFAEDICTTLHKLNKFVVVLPETEYFWKFYNLAISGEEISPVVLRTTPEMPGMSAERVRIVFNIDSEQDLLAYATILYDPNKPEEDLINEFNLVWQNIKNKHFIILKANSGFNFYKKYLRKNPDERIRYADALFYDEKYKEALKEYNNLVEYFPKYTMRMSAWCKLHLGLVLDPSPHSIDILVFAGDVPAVYYASRQCEMPWRLAAEYWLAFQEMPEKKKLLVWHSCLVGFSGMKKKESVGLFRNKIEEYLAQQEDSPFWSEVRRRIKEEQ